MSVQRRPFSDLKNTPRIHMPSAPKLSSTVLGNLVEGGGDENAPMFTSSQKDLHEVEQKRRVFGNLKNTPRIHMSSVAKLTVRGNLVGGRGKLGDEDENVPATPMCTSQEDFHEVEKKSRVFGNLKNTPRAQLASVVKLSSTLRGGPIESGGKLGGENENAPATPMFNITTASDSCNHKLHRQSWQKHLQSPLLSSPTFMNSNSNSEFACMRMENQSKRIPDRRFTYLPMEDRFEDCRPNLAKNFDVLEDDLPSSPFDYEAVLREYQQKYA